jgi:iron complex outermembrane receptor protein
MCARLLCVLVTVGCVLACCGASLHAQEPCQEVLEGVITEGSAAVEGARVRVRRLGEGGEWRTIKTGSEGAYRFAGLCEGEYELEVLASGLSPLSEVVEVPLVRRADWGLSEALSVEVRAAQEAEGYSPQETLEGRALDQTRGLSLGESLKAINGVRAIETGTITKPVIHGMSGSRVQILVDGVRHEAQSWGLDHAPEVDPFQAHHLTVVKGAAGVRYGQGALGGVILVEPPALPRAPTVAGEAHLVGISNGEQGAGSLMLLGSPSWLPALGWRAQVSGRVAAGQETPDYALDNTGARELNASGELGLRGERFELSLSSSLFSTRVGVFTGLLAENVNVFREQLGRARPLNASLFESEYEVERPYQEVNHVIAQGRAGLDLGELGGLRLQVSAQRNRREEFDLVRRSVTGPQVDFTLETLQGELVWRLDTVEGFLAEVGAVGSRQENVFRGRRLVPNYRANGGAVFGWAQLQEGDWALELGARLGVTDIDTFQRERTGGDQASVEAHDLSYLTPSLLLGGRWSPAASLELTLNLSAASRAPAVNELFIDGVSQGLAAFERGDLGLSPEQTWGASLELRWSPVQPVTLEVTSYASWIDDFIYMAPALEPDGQPEITQTINGGFPTFQWLQEDALYYGVDAALTLRPARWIELQTRAATVRAQAIARDQPLVLIPPDLVEQRLRLSRAALGPLRESYLSGQLAWTARQDRVDPRADFLAPPDGYLLVGAAVGASWGEEAPLWLDLEVKNALDQRYRNYLSRQRYFADEPGRSFVVRLKALF